MKKYFLIWFVIWLIISIVVAATGNSKILPGIALAAFISLVFMLKTLSEQWSGTVTDVKTVTEYANDDSGGSMEVTYAFIKLANGKIKKTRSMGWKVGDKLEKRRGEATVRVLS
jgi:hypothetical protein